MAALNLEDDEMKGNFSSLKWTSYSIMASPFSTGLEYIQEDKE
jgi:hypothetical protein